MIGLIWKKIKAAGGAVTCHRAIHLWIAVTYAAAALGLEPAAAELALFLLYAGLCARG